MLTREDLYRRHDWNGECDDCHHDNCQLWEDMEEPGEWQICADCIRKNCRKREARAAGAGIPEVTAL